jgi:hypothetical protein
VDSVAVPGTYPFTIRGTGANAPPVVTHLLLTVPKPSFALLTTTSVAVTINSPRFFAVDVSATRENGFRGAVTFTVTGAPTGVTVAGTFAISATSNGASFFVSAGSTAVPGTYQLTVRATGPEADERTANVTLTVLPPA